MLEKANKVFVKLEEAWSALTSLRVSQCSPPLSYFELRKCKSCSVLHRTCDFILGHQLDQKNMFVATAYPGTLFF